MGILEGVVIVIAVIGAVLAIIGICVAFGAITMMMDDFMNGPTVQPKAVPYAERTPQGGQLEPYYVEMLAKKAKEEANAGKQ